LIRRIKWKPGKGEHHESIEYNGIRYTIHHGLTNQNDDLFADNPGIDDVDFNVISVFKSLGFNSIIYGYGFKRI
jgi:hypothetical protein